MEFSRKQISTILEALKASPRGMNVSEVSRATGMNRSTVSKYLEMLYVSGQVDRRTFGTSKLYYISQRMPISAFLSFSSDLIIFLDKYSRVLNANDSFFEFTGIRREDVVHKAFDNFAFPLKFNPSIMPYIEDAIDGREASIESYYPKKESGRYFNIKLIPLLFDDGEKGATIIFEDITEKKLAERALLNANYELEKKVRERTKELEKANDALRESEERYRMITEKSYDIVFSVLPDGAISYVSPQIAYYGYDPGQLYGRKLFDFISASYREFMTEKFRETMLNGETPPIEFKFLRKDGTEQWAEVTAKVIYDDAGKPLFNVGTVRDIEERKKAEEALRNSELKFKTLFEGASTAIFIIDLETRAITDCNTYAARLVGRTKEDLAGMHHSKLHPAEMAGPCRNNVKIHSKDGSVMNYEAELVHSDGRRIPVLINAAILEIDGKRSMIGSYLDITERKRAEEALQNSEEKFRALTDSSIIGVMLIQGEDTIYVNRALADLFGYTIEECMNLKYWDTALPEMKEHIRMRAILRQRGEPGPARNELKMVKKNGEYIWLDCTAAILEVKGKPAMMLTAMDITGKKMMEQELRKSEGKFRNLVENVPVMVWEIDENYNCTYTSPKSMEILGYEPEEILGKTPFDFISPDDLERVQKLIKPFLDEHKPFEINEYIVVRKDGLKITIGTNATPLFDDNGQFKGYRGINAQL